MNELLQDELNDRAMNGQKQVPLIVIKTKLKELGYKLVQPISCYYLARYMTGPRAGKSYPAVSTRIHEIDSGLSFAIVNARRDDNFNQLQALRFNGEMFTVIRGCILDL